MWCFSRQHTGQPSNTAAETVRSLAKGAGSANQIRVAGRADYAEAVELVRDGVPASSITSSAIGWGPDEANEGRQSLVRYDEQL